MNKKEYLRRRHEQVKPAYEALMKVYPFTFDDLDGEEWKPIPDYDYQISNFGRVKRFYKNGKQKIIQPMLNNGYLQIRLSKDRKYKCFKVHRLVVLAFVPNPEGKPQINHIDGIKFNNHVSNLEWCTGSENVRHAFDNELRIILSGEDHRDSKLTNEQARYVRDNPLGLTGVELAKMFGIEPATINAIQLGKSYKNAGGSVRKARPKKPRIADDLRKQIRAEYQAGVRGFGYQSLAKKYGVSPMTIWGIVHEFK